MPGSKIACTCVQPVTFSENLFISPDKSTTVETKDGLDSLFEKLMQNEPLDVTGRLSYTFPLKDSKYKDNRREQVCKFMFIISFYMYPLIHVEEQFRVSIENALISNPEKSKNTIIVI